MAQEIMLVIAPHADDAEFGLGGWLYRMQEEEVGVARVVIAACGNYRRADGELVEEGTRRAEAVTALRDLKVEEVFFREWFKENEATEARYGDIVAGIEAEIRDYRPTEVFIPLPSFNQDHRVVYEAALTALRPGMFNSHLKHVWGYEYPGNAWGSDRPNVGRAYIELNARHLARKRQALMRHKSQFEGRVVAVDPEAAARMALQRGSEAGLMAAECLYLLREVHKCL